MVVAATPISSATDDRRRDELPGRHAGRARDHQFEPARQIQVAGHGADQHAERHDALGELRHAEERDLRHQERRNVRDVGRCAAASRCSRSSRPARRRRRIPRARRRGSAARNSARACRSRGISASRLCRTPGRCRSVRALMALVTKAGGSMIRPREIPKKPAPNVASDRQILERPGPTACGADDDADEADQPQQRHAADGADQRQGAALPGGARRTEIGKGDHDEGERIKRRREAVMQLGAELAGLRLRQADRPDRGNSSSHR